MSEHFVNRVLLWGNISLITYQLGYLVGYREISHFLYIILSSTPPRLTKSPRCRMYDNDAAPFHRDIDSA